EINQLSGFRTLAAVWPRDNRRIVHLDQMIFLQTLNLTQSVLGAIRLRELEDGHSCHNPHSFHSLRRPATTVCRLRHGISEIRDTTSQAITKIAGRNSAAF